MGVDYLTPAVRRFVTSSTVTEGVNNDSAVAKITQHYLSVCLTVTEAFMALDACFLVSSCTIKHNLGLTS